MRSMTLRYLMSFAPGLDAVAGEPTARPLDEDMAPVPAALEDDLNTPAVRAVLNALAGQIHAIAGTGRRAKLAAAPRQAGVFLGLLGQDATDWTQAGVDDVTRIEALVAERTLARAARDRHRADALREGFSALGVEVEDAGGESCWRVRA